jgi:multisubunit Na+/H+ antiporter MnhF subunit
VNEWLWSAAVLTVALASLVGVAVRGTVLDGVVALEAAGALTVTVLLLIAEGTRRQSFVDLAVIMGVTSWAGAIAFLRFLRRGR